MWLRGCIYRAGVRVGVSPKRWKQPTRQDPDTEASAQLSQLREREIHFISFQNHGINKPLKLRERRLFPEAKAWRSENAGVRTQVSWLISDTLWICHMAFPHGGTIERGSKVPGIPRGASRKGRLCWDAMCCTTSYWCQSRNLGESRDRDWRRLKSLS